MSRYTTTDGKLEITLDCRPPMGDGSGYIPPPFIDFYRDGASVRFYYRGAV